ncbi:MAG: GNAT family N-acetyltransferase [Rickettsiales bacterium]|jgi:ribosomal-protein-serine acetyltransferase|nr:GNAT family N-acetyltransferase [Rickettsiales bacterium]
MKDFPEIIKDGDLSLVKLAPTFENTKKVFDLIDRNREYLKKWVNWTDYVQKPEDEFLTVQDMGKKETGAFFILLDDEIVGAIEFFNVKEKYKSAEIGYWIGQEFSGRGIASRAVRLMEKMFFADFGWNRLVIETDVKNGRSVRVRLAQKLGYHLDGELRQAYKVSDDGDFIDLFVFSKLKSEWTMENKNA